MHWLNDAGRGRASCPPADSGPTAPGSDFNHAALRPVLPASIAPLASARPRSTIARMQASAPLRLRHADRL